MEGFGAAPASPTPDNTRELSECEGASECECPSVRERERERERERGIVRVYLCEHTCLPQFDIRVLRVPVDVRVRHTQPSLALAPRLRE
jgi:hypothetical protein